MAEKELKINAKAYVDYAVCNIHFRYGYDD